MKRGLCIVFFFSFLSLAAKADVFRCTNTDGKTVYQETPCTVGTQKALDDRDIRRQESVNELRKKESDQIAKQRQAEVARKEEQLAELKREWTACQAKKDCVDLCYGVGERHAVVYLANFRGMAQNSIMASDVMTEGCQQAVGHLSQLCVTQCERGFKLKAKSIIK